MEFTFEMRMLFADALDVAADAVLMLQELAETSGLGAGADAERARRLNSAAARCVLLDRMRKTRAGFFKACETERAQHDKAARILAEFARDFCRAHGAGPKAPEPEAEAEAEASAELARARG